jgi:predicted RNA-binding Zn-ribbon protein involved in translation (DUF1610 family)
MTLKECPNCYSVKIKLTSQTGQQKTYKCSECCVIWTEGII